MAERPVGDSVDRALRSAIRALAEAAPEIDELPDLLGSTSRREPSKRGRRLVAAGVAAVVALASGAWWSFVRSDDQFIASDAELAACDAERSELWCVDGPAGLALVDGVAWTVDRFGHLIGLDTESGVRRQRSPTPVAVGPARVLGGISGRLLIGAGDELIITDESGVPSEIHRPRPGWAVVDADGTTPASLLVVVARDGEQDLIGIAGGQVVELAQEASPESVEALADGRIVVLDSATRELVVVDGRGTVTDRLFTRMPMGSIAAHRAAVVVLPATGSDSTVLWLAVDDGTVTELALPGFDPGQPIAADPVRRQVATADPAANRVVVADVPRSTEFDS